jgi:hypothetical protein
LRRCWFVEAMITVALSAASALASDSPMPVAPPVMTATLFLKSVIGLAVIEALPFAVGVWQGCVLDQCCGNAVDIVVCFG